MTVYLLTASRIHISWSCRDNLLAANEGFEIKERGKVELKGKGELFTYWLCGKDDYDRPLPDWDAEDGPSHGLKIDDYLNVRNPFVYFITFNSASFVISFPEYFYEDL